MKHPMDRAERRHATEQVAIWRANLYPSEWNIVGKFRKWNLTCQCSMCQCIKYCEIRWQRMKDERRNIEFEDVGV